VVAVIFSPTDRGNPLRSKGHVEMEERKQRKSSKRESFGKHVAGGIKIGGEREITYPEG